MCSTWRDKEIERISRRVINLFGNWNEVLITPEILANAIATVVYEELREHDHVGTKNEVEITPMRKLVLS